MRKILGAPFRQAVKLGTLQTNPLASLDPLKTNRIEKGVFTVEEVSRLLTAADKDWKGLILIAYLTGMRLRDAVDLKQENIDLEAKLISFQAAKTEQKLVIPMHEDLLNHLLSLPSSDDPKAFLFPTLASKRTPALSVAFKQIMGKAGIDGGVAREKLGSKGKTISSRSFHSLRHSFVSALANANVSAELRQRLSGHASEEMHKLYTHHELETMRRAVTSIPRLPKGEL